MSLLSQQDQEREKVKYVSRLVAHHMPYTLWWLRTLPERERERGRERERDGDRERDRQRETDRQTDRDRETNTE